VKKHLTELAIQRIKTPKEGTVEYFDLGYPGLSLRVGHGGAKSFQQFYRLNGKLIRESFGRWPAISLGAARTKWRETREKLAKGELVIREAKSPSLSFDGVVEDWLKRVSLTTACAERAGIRGKCSLPQSRQPHAWCYLAQ
jgi:hypothetical protein